MLYPLFCFKKNRNFGCRNIDFPLAWNLRGFHALNKIILLLLFLGKLKVKGVDVIKF